MNRKTIFDTVRRMLGRGFRQSEVDALDRALDAAEGNSNSDRVADASPCEVSPTGIQLIKSFEGCAQLRPDGLYSAYPDPGTGGAPWTIGWGATGPDIGPTPYGRSSSATPVSRRMSHAMHETSHRHSAVAQPRRASSMPSSAFTITPVPSAVPH